MDRRTFLAGTGAVLLAAPLVAKAQQAKEVPRIGYLLPNASRPTNEAFWAGLRDLGYVEGQNVTIERRYADGNSQRDPCSRVGSPPGQHDCCRRCRSDECCAAGNGHDPYRHDRGGPRGVGTDQEPESTRRKYHRAVHECTESHGQTAWVAQGGPSRRF